MNNNFLHITIVHQRYDIRIFYKQCVSLSRSGLGNVSLIVADDRGDEFLSGINILDIGIPSKNRFGRIFIGNFRVWKKIKNKQYDIIHIHDPELLLLGLALKIQGNNVIYDMHENLPKEILTKSYINRIFRYPLSFLVKFFQNIILRIIPVVFAENSYAKDFRSIKKSTTVLNFPIIEKMKLIAPIKHNKFTVGYVGAISKERGAFMQLQAIHELRMEGMDIETIFIGPCGDEVVNSEIYSLAISEGWAYFGGRVKPEVAWDEISKCHIGLAVLEPSPNFVESYPTKLFEYMTLAIPCIVSDFIMYRKIIEEAQCGLLVNPLNIKELKNAIIWMYYNYNEALKMGESGKQFIFSKYNWESEFLKLKQLYSDVIH